MMRSLWAGVTGLQAHQIAMDVEGNNIANVNTAGFKYSRANFSDLLSQTSKIATAPQGDLGGKNPMQIGLGTQVSSVTKIFKQGSVQVTDKNTDLAIQGDGFFVISPDGGSTYKYTRNGDFTFDAQGNFTDSNGYIIQGWVRDIDTGEIDATTPIADITIPPGLTTPANDTSFIALKANLNSGNSIVNKKSIYELDSHNRWYDKDGDGLRSTSEMNNENSTVDMFNTDKDLVERGLDMAVVFDTNGDSLLLAEDQGIWVSYADAKTSITLEEAPAPMPTLLNITLNGKNISAAITAGTAEEAANQIANKIEEYYTQTGVRASVENGTQVVLTNKNDQDTEAQFKNIDLKRLDGDNTGFFTTKVLTAYQYTYSEASITPTFAYNASTARKFHTTEDLRAAMQVDAREYVNYGSDRVDESLLSSTANQTESYDVTFEDLADGETVTIHGLTYTNNSGGPILANAVATDFYNYLNGIALAGGGAFTGGLKGGYTAGTLTVPDLVFLQTDVGDAVDLIVSENATASKTDEGQIYLPWATVREDNLNDGVEVTVNSQGQFQITNPKEDAFDEVLITANNPVSAFANITQYSDVLFPAGTVFDRGVAIIAPSDKSITLLYNEGSSYTIPAGGQWNTPPGGAILDTEVNFPQGTIITEARETYVVTMPNGMTAGETIILDGATLTCPAAPNEYADAAAVATAFLTTAAPPLANYTATDNGDGTITLTANDFTDTADVANTGTASVTVTQVVTAVDDATITGTVEIDVGTTGIIYDANDEPDDHDMNLLVTARTDRLSDISANTRLTTTFSALQGTLISGSAIRTTQNLYAANHASSIDVYDSLGSKHTVRVEFTKIASNTEGSEWSMMVSVDEPGQINYSGVGLSNKLSGTISFNSDGSLSSPPNPSSITFSANNGSTPNQNILLKFGTSTQFDGMTSFDAQSNTSGISQDGYPGGDLGGIRIDETGTLIGSFTNGRSFGLAQVAMAKFSNNEGLESDGGNTFIQTSNSGDPVIGQAALGGRGFVQASSLEMSNVDLSRSLTQLIVIQRGYQANSKTITTSDQMLNTLLQLKQ
jgi:flagellar hook-basal body protein